MNLKKIIDRSFEIGMTQHRQEIYGLSDFLQNQSTINVMEIGSKRGGTFWIWCKMFSGKKISIDEFGIDPRTKEDPQLWSDEVYLLKKDSHEPSTLKEVEDILQGEKLDFLFIDGDHSEHGVKTDYKMYKSLVNKGGYIAFHDINKKVHKKWKRFKMRVYRLWRELEGEKLEFNIHGPYGGIGIIKVS